MIKISSALLVLTINIITTLILSKRKYSLSKTLIGIVLYTLLVFGLTSLILQYTNNDTMLDIYSIFLGWSYLFLFLILLDNHITTIITIMAFSLSHTLFVLGFVYHIFIIYTGEYKSIYFILSQMIVFSFSTPFTIKFIKQTLIKVTGRIHKYHQKSTFLLPLLIFTLVYISRFFIDFSSIYILLIYYVSLLLIVILTYILITSLIIGLNRIENLSTQLHIDPLTKTKNRLALYHDFNKIKSHKSIFVLFMDLNQFKTINDVYGHLIGDDYLVQFSKILRNVIQNQDEIYRISGDEFIVLSTGEPYNIAQLKLKIQHTFDYSIKFLGVSIGISNTISDGKTLDQLLSIADQRMYEDKNKVLE